MLLVMGFSFRSPTGSISGVIKDQSAAPLPGVPVKLLNAATHAHKTALSDANGTFQFVQLEPGNWLVSAEAPGFKRVTIPAVIVQVDQVTDIEITMRVGDVSEVIEVAAVSPLLEPDKSTLSSVIGNRAIKGLP